MGVTVFRFFVLFALQAQVFSLRSVLEPLDIGNFLINHINIRENNVFLTLIANYKSTDQDFSPVVCVTRINEYENEVNYFPFKELYIPQESILSDECSEIDNAIATTSDKYQRVYILDNSLECGSKIVISDFKYSFIHTNIPLNSEGINPKSILALNQRYPVVIVGISNTNIILVCTLDKNCEDVAVKVPMVDWKENTLKSTEIMALYQEKIFVTSTDQRELFSLKIEDINRIVHSSFEGVTTVIEATYIGNLMGNTNSIYVHNSIFYYLIPDFNTVAAWNTTFELNTENEAENHDVKVLDFSNYDVYLEQLFVDELSEKLFVLIKTRKNESDEEIEKNGSFGFSSNIIEVSGENNEY